MAGSQDRIALDAYKIPSRETPVTLDSFVIREQLLLPPQGQWSSLRETAKNLGLEPTDRLSTYHGIWDTYQKTQLSVPNFGTVDTEVNVALGLYSRLGDTRQILEPESSIASHAVVHISTSYIHQEGFYSDLHALARNFIERPEYFGFPSRFLESGRFWCASTVIGVVAGVGLGVLTNGENAGAALPAFLGALGGAGLGTGITALSERIAKGRISYPKKYRSNLHAADALNAIPAHITETRLKREVHNIFGERGFKYEPGEFLDKVWDYIPDHVLDPRAQEVLEIPPLAVDPPRVFTPALERLVQTALVVREPSESETQAASDQILRSVRLHIEV